MMENTVEKEETPNIVDIIKKHVPLKKKGSSFVGQCPFHVEKTNPNFVVNSDKKMNMFYCFDCGLGGNVIEFKRLWFQIKGAMIRT